jgi:hypothetical protein
VGPEIGLWPETALASRAPGRGLGFEDPGADPSDYAGDLMRLPPTLRSQALVRLQQRRGNAYVQRVARYLRHPLQAKPSLATDQPDEETLADRIEAAAGSGYALDARTAEDFGARLDADLSQVRLHTGPEAEALADALDAIAFTSGQDIFFSQSAPPPESPEARRLLAHEVAHTLQQAAGPVDGAPSLGGVLLSSPADRFEQAAEATAEALTASQSSTPQESIGQTRERGWRLSGSVPSPQRRRERAAVTVQRQPEVGGEAVPLEEDSDEGATVTIDEEGVTSVDYQAPSFTTKNEKVKPPKPPPGTKPEDDLVDVTATAVATFKAKITVDLPKPPDGLTACQRKRVQEAIDQKLAPHEQQHVAAFKLYDGVYEEAFELTGIPRAQVTAALTAKAKEIADAEGPRRKQVAQDKSDALDKPPFVVNVDLDCDDKKSQSGESKAAPAAAAENPEPA